MPSVAHPTRLKGYGPPKSKNGARGLIGLVRSSRLFPDKPAKRVRTGLPRLYRRLRSPIWFPHLAELPRACSAYPALDACVDGAHAHRTAPASSIHAVTTRSPDDVPVVFCAPDDHFEVVCGSHVLDSRAASMPAANGMTAVPARSARSTHAAADWSANRLLMICGQRPVALQVVGVRSTRCVRAGPAPPTNPPCATTTLVTIGSGAGPARAVNGSCGWGIRPIPTSRSGDDPERSDGLQR